MSSTVRPAFVRRPPPGASIAWAVVRRPDQVVEDDAVADLAGQLHHLHAGGADVDRHVLRARSPCTMSISMSSTSTNSPWNVTRSIARSRRTVSTVSRMARSGCDRVDADLRGQRVPPRADAEDHPAGRQVVERGERRGQQADVAGPVVHHAGADLDPLGHRRVRRHRHRRLADQPALRLPHGLEAALPPRSGRSSMPSRIGCLSCRYSATRPSLVTATLVSPYRAP